MNFFADVYTIWLREMIRTFRARSRIISSLAMPIFWLVLIGVGFGSSFRLPNLDYLPFLAPGVIGMIILFNSTSSGVSVIWDRQFGFLKEILVAPVSRTSIVVGKMLGGATVGTMTALIMLALSLAIGIIGLSLGILMSIIFMVLTSLCFVSIGLIIASTMRSMEGFQLIMSFLIMPAYFLSGALFPLSNTPLWMQAISSADPLTYGVDGIRGSLVNFRIYPIWLDFSVLMFFAFALIILGSYLFRKMSI